MAPQPKTYGTRRSHAKPACGLVNGTTANEPDFQVRKADVNSQGMGTGKEKDSGTTRKEEKQDIPSQGLRKEDESASGTPLGGPAAPLRMSEVEDESTTTSPAPGFLENRRMSTQDMLPPGTLLKERGSSRKSIRRSLDESATSGNHKAIGSTGFDSISIESISPSQAKSNFRPNGFTEDHGRSPVRRDIDFKDTPNDLSDLGGWVAQLISKHSEKSALSIVLEPRQEDSSTRPRQDTEIKDDLDNVEGVRMTRGKEKKRLQQLKGKLLANELSGKYIAEIGKSLQPRDAARIERRLKNDLNDELKQVLFGNSVRTDMSTNVVERNACGTLMFNTLVDIGDSANLNSAAVLKSALEERKDDTPFCSALKILASSPQVMAFIKFFLSKEDPPQWEASNADESRPSTGLYTSGATTITETSGLTSRAETSISDAEILFKATTNKISTKKKTPEKQKRSQEVTQTLEAATTVLVQIQQGEAGIGYITPFASGSMVSNPIGQGLPTTYGGYGLPYPGHPTNGMAYGPPMGAHLNNYDSPYTNPVAPHPSIYASPYFNPVNQPPANYASPYANPVVPKQTGGSSLDCSGDNQANKHDGHETYHDNKKAHIPYQNTSGAVIEASIGCVEDVGQHKSNGKGDASRASDEANGQGLGNKKKKANSVVDLDETAVDDAPKKDSSGDEDEASKDEDEDLMKAKTENQNIAPPAENHKLFTGERLGDFTSLENIDWLLTVGNGGEIPTSKKARMSSPSRTSSSETDAKVQNEVSKIISDIMLFKDWRGYPGGTIKQFFYASTEGQRLAAELKRLMAITTPVVNTIIPRPESEARLRLYRQLEGRAIREKRDREIQEDINRRYGAPIPMQQWVPPPVGFPVAGLPIPAPLPSNGPIEKHFVRRGNVIAAPPGGRNKEEERKAETYGYPPLPGSRPGCSQQGQKRKIAALH